MEIFIFLYKKSGLYKIVSILFIFFNRIEMIVLGIMIYQSILQMLKSLHINFSLSKKKNSLKVSGNILQKFVILNT